MEREAKRKELLSDAPQALRPKRTKEPHELTLEQEEALREVGQGVQGAYTHGRG